VERPVELKGLNEIVIFSAVETVNRVGADVHAPRRVPLDIARASSSSRNASSSSIPSPRLIGSFPSLNDAGISGYQATNGLLDAPALLTGQQTGGKPGMACGEAARTQGYIELPGPRAGTARGPMKGLMRH
jgi:hypothetical protein